MEKPRPNLCTQDGRDHREGLDAKKNKTLLEEEKCFHLTSPFIEPFPPPFPPDTHYERAPLIVYGWVVVESNFGKE